MERIRVAGGAAAKAAVSRWVRRPVSDGDEKGRSTWARGRVLAALAVMTAGLFVFHSALPDSMGSLVEAFLPWFGLAVVVLLILAVVRRSATALVALLLPVAAWIYGFGGLLLPVGEPGGHDLVVVQHNVSDENTDPAGTARALAKAEPDLIAVEELVPSAVPVYEGTFAADFPYHAVQGTVGLWSRHPLSGVRALDIKPDGITEEWNRGLRAVVSAPHGELAVHVAHLPSVRVRASGLASAWRDESAGLLGKAVAAEEVTAVILLGDLNGTVDDRGLGPLTSRMNVAERGLAFSFPVSFPVARIDQVMARSATVRHVRTLPATGSDHLPIAARVTPG
ncbi:endonuclease/exonuclease/phosphatase family protein [Actinomadura madurae]|nr:endonuclease/exonuclease/phosphatase family protein [Actinomadura madurae]URN10740.1 endonuclease/exonuclease/phosphatase family protein [Actinomadura madurae]